MKNCPICCNKYTSKLRRRITCSFCKHHSCAKCIIVYLQLNILNTRCMFCSYPTTLQMVKPVIARGTFKSLLALEINALFDREVLLILNSERTFNQFVHVHRMMALREILTADGVEEPLIEEILNSFGYGNAPSPAQVQFCSACEVPISNSTCIHCNTEYCRSCLSPITGQHSCDSTVVESIDIITKTCKQCPVCKTMIEKEPGECDQMFCIKCHTTFSWLTGEVARPEETRHNPHFYEWRRSQGFQDRNPDDDPCEGHFLIKNATNTQLLFIHAVIQRSILTMNEIAERDDLIREAMRLNYIIKRISLAQWKRRFSKHIKTLRRNSDLRDILRICLQSIYYVSLALNDTSVFKNLFHLFTEHIQTIHQEYLNDESTQYIISEYHVVLPYGV